MTRKIVKRSTFFAFFSVEKKLNVKHTRWTGFCRFWRRWRRGRGSSRCFSNRRRSLGFRRSCRRHRGRCFGLDRRSWRSCDL